MKIRAEAPPDFAFVLHGDRIDWAEPRKGRRSSIHPMAVTKEFRPDTPYIPYVTVFQQVIRSAKNLKKLLTAGFYMDIVGVQG